MYDNTEAVRLNRTLVLNAAAALDVVARSASSAAHRLRSTADLSARPIAGRARAERPRDRLGPCEQSLHGYEPQRVWRLK